MKKGEELKLENGGFLVKGEMQLETQKDHIITRLSYDTLAFLLPDSKPYQALTDNVILLVFKDPILKVNQEGTISLGSLDTTPKKASNIFTSLLQTGKMKKVVNADEENPEKSRLENMLDGENQVFFKSFF